MDISKAFKELRKKVGMKQNEAARHIGITQSYLSQIEGGNKEASTALLQTMCKVYGVPASVFYFKAMDSNDVPKGKRKIYNELKPLIDNLIDQIF